VNQDTLRSITKALLVAQAQMDSALEALQALEESAIKAGWIRDPQAVEALLTLKGNRS
jgi:hypothetical protein